MTVSGAALMQESDAQNICIELHGLITKENYEQIVWPALEKARAELGEFNLLFYYRDYAGWERGAADLSFQAIHTFGPHVLRGVYVMPPASKILHIKLVGETLIKGEVRYYDEAELDKAVQWLKTGRD